MTHLDSIKRRVDAADRIDCTRRRSGCRLSRASDQECNKQYSHQDGDHSRTAPKYGQTSASHLVLLPIGWNPCPKCCHVERIEFCLRTMSKTRARSLSLPPRRYSNVSACHPRVTHSSHACHLLQASSGRGRTYCCTGLQTRRRAPHEPVADSKYGAFLDDLKAETAVELDVLRLIRFQVGCFAIAVEKGTIILHQPLANAFALELGLDSHRSEMRMGFSWVNLLPCRPPHENTGSGPPRSQHQFGHQSDGSPLPG